MKPIRIVFFYILLFAVGLLFINKAQAQWVYSDLQLQDIQRIHQIADSTNPDNNSYLIRSSSNYWNNILPERSYKKWPLVKLLQAGVTLHKNDQLTISENDGTLIPAVGMQQRFTIGAILNLCYSAQQPELANLIASIVQTCIAPIARHGMFHIQRLIALRITWDNPNTISAKPCL